MLGHVHVGRLGRELQVELLEPLGGFGDVRFGSVTFGKRSLLAVEDCSG
jgi:hypothetical protein